MKLKSLLFGSAAAVMAVTGAQAADLPVAEPVEYVRICDAFGAGFYYIPGTDTCLKVGGRVRVEAHYVNGDDQGDTFNEFTSRARGYVRLDARTQTDFGLLRAYVSSSLQIGPSSFADNYDEGQYLENAFIQLSNDMGTLTVGHASSFFDFFGTYGYGTRIGIDDNTTEQTLFAYTFNVGNGVSATLSFEDAASGGRRAHFDGVVIDGQEFPDVVANVRVDQGWGSAQIMGVLHDTGVDSVSDDLGLLDDDDSDLGWAIGAGVTAGIPGTGFEASVQANYTQGAVSYITAGVNSLILENTLSDVTIDEDGSLELTKAWNVRGGISADFATQWTASLNASYTDIDYEALGDLDFYGITGNVAWTPVSGFLMGVEVAYNNVDWEFADEDSPDDIWGVMFRAQRTF
ncbi:porin [Afifella sp. JA880]|uniref:porin n=1 Tax=Afifella sp. JA880 TaxID=2975280 RepID=UPI0021BAFB14|nr:porin [Afifella sp. JA880]MCT8267669.1 porin [Afifella sp. JA880]